MITCCVCQNKALKLKIKELKISNLTYLMCEDCFKTYKNMRSKEVLRVGR